MIKYLLKTFWGLFQVAMYLGIWLTIFVLFLHNMPSLVESWKDNEPWTVSLILIWIFLSLLFFLFKVMQKAGVVLSVGKQPGGNTPKGGKIPTDENKRPEFDHSASKRK